MVHVRVGYLACLSSALRLHWLKLVVCLDVVRRLVDVTQLLNPRQRQLDSLDDALLECRVVTNEFLNGSSDENGIFLLLQDALVTLRREDEEEAGNDIGARRKLVLTRLIEAKGADCVRNRLNDLRNGELGWQN